MIDVIIKLIDEITKTLNFGLGAITIFVILILVSTIIINDRLREIERHLKDLKSLLQSRDI
jgi:hypothetical protein